MLAPDGVQVRADSLDEKVERWSKVDLLSTSLSNNRRPVLPPPPVNRLKSTVKYQAVIPRRVKAETLERF